MLLQIKFENFCFLNIAFVTVQFFGFNKSIQKEGAMPDIQPLCSFPCDISLPLWKGLLLPTLSGSQWQPLRITISSFNHSTNQLFNPSTINEYTNNAFPFNPFPIHLLRQSNQDINSSIFSAALGGFIAGNGFLFTHSDGLNLVGIQSKVGI